MDNNHFNESTLCFSKRSDNLTKEFYRKNDEFGSNTKY